MTIFFDNVLEYLTEDDKALHDYLCGLKKQLIAAEVCPRGELERSYMCRQFLRDSTNRVQKKIKDSGFKINRASMDVLEQTHAIIEDVGACTEMERVLIVIRNLLILMDNLVMLQDNKKISVRVPLKRNKKEFSIIRCDVTKTGKVEFLKTIDIPADLKKEDLSKPLINEKVMKVVNKAKMIADGLEENAVEERYRTIFYYLAISEIFRREKAQ